MMLKRGMVAGLVVALLVGAPLSSAAARRHYPLIFLPFAVAGAAVAGAAAVATAPFAIIAGPPAPYYPPPPAYYPPPPPAYYGAPAAPGYGYYPR